ncbi:hypothetical protein [Pseudomonas extremaustralis]
MKKILIALIFPLLLGGCYNDSSTTERLNSQTQEEINNNGTNKGIQAGFGCGVAELSQNGSNLLHNVKKPTVQCEETKVKENGANLIGVSIYELLEVAILFASIVIILSVILKILNIVFFKEGSGKGKNIIALAMSVVLTMGLCFPFFKVKTSDNIEFHITAYAIIKMSLFQTVADATTTNIEKVMNMLSFTYPTVKMPIKAGNTDSFEALNDYIIRSHSSNKNPVYFKFYQEGDKVIGYSYHKNLKATVSITLDKSAIEIGKQIGFNNIEAYQINEIHKALEKSFNYANKTAITAGQAYSEIKLVWSKKTFDLTSVKSDSLDCDGYANMKDLATYTTDSIQGAYRKAAAACASTILADTLSSYRNTTSNEALKQSYLKNNYISYCSEGSENYQPTYTFKEAKEKAKTCVIEACSSSAFICSVGLNVYKSYNEDMEQIIKSNSYTKAVAMLFMGSNNPDFQEGANTFLNSFNVSFEEIEDEKIVASKKEPLFTITLNGYIDLSSDDWDTEMGYINQAYTAIAGFSAQLPSMSDVLNIFSFGNSGKFGLKEASTCLKSQLQVKDGYSCGSVIDTQRLFFLRLIKNGIDGYTMKVVLTSQNKAIKSNLNAEIKKQVTDFGMSLGSVAKLASYLVATSSDKNLYGTYTQDLTLQPEQALIYIAMFFSNQQVLDFLSTYFSAEIILGLMGYYLIPVMAMTLFLSQQIVLWINVIFNFVFHTFQALRRLTTAGENQDSVSMPDYMKSTFITLIYLACIPLSFTMSWLMLNAFFAELPSVEEMAQASVAFEPTSLVSMFFYDITTTLIAIIYIFIITTVALTPIVITTIMASWMAFKQRGFMEVEEDVHKELDRYWSKS